MSKQLGGEENAENELDESSTSKTIKLEPNSNQIDNQSLPNENDLVSIVNIKAEEIPKDCDTNVETKNSSSVVDLTVC